MTLIFLSELNCVCLFQTLGQVVDLPSAIYCIDHDHSGSKAKIAAGTGMRIFVLKIEKKDILKRPS